MSIFLDAHVHIHPDFSVEQLLDAALENFIQAAVRAGDVEPRDYVLCLTESSGVNVFSELKKIADSIGPLSSEPLLPLPGSWQFCTTSQQHCVTSRNSDGNLIYILAGRQLISSEHLELLSIGAPVNFQDYCFPLEELAERVWGGGGLPLLPWGVGKWMGKRSSEVERFIQTNHDYPVVLGDNGNRPVFWPYPRQFSFAATKKLSIISGSDPLPLPGHHLRAGSYGGWVAHRQLDKTCPVTDVQSIMTEPGYITAFGKRAGVFQFLRDQLLVNVRKRLPNFLS